MLSSCKPQLTKVTRIANKWCAHKTDSVLLPANLYVFYNIKCWLYNTTTTLLHAITTGARQNLPALTATQVKYLALRMNGQGRVNGVAMVTSRKSNLSSNSNSIQSSVQMFIYRFQLLYSKEPKIHKTLEKSSISTTVLNTLKTSRILWELSTHTTIDAQLQINTH